MAGKLQVGEKLRIMNRQEPFDGLDLHNHEFFYEQIQTKSCVNPDAPVANRQTNLGLDRQIAAFQLEGEALLVHRLQQARTEGRVYDVGCVDNRPRHSIVLR